MDVVPSVLKTHDLPIATLMRHYQEPHLESNFDSSRNARRLKRSFKRGESVWISCKNRSRFYPGDVVSNPLPIQENGILLERLKANPLDFRDDCALALKGTCYEIDRAVAEFVPVFRAFFVGIDPV